jgi:Spy/CpxP family protein refolding chaperone
MVFAASLAACTTLAAQQPAQAPPPPVVVREVRPADVEMARVRQAREVEGMRYAELRNGEPLEANLFPPELIMRRQRDIGLQPAQRTQITQTIGRLEAALVELQWTLQDQQQALAELLQQQQVNAEATMQAFDRVLATEASVKRTHFQALLQIRNVLTPEQQNQLRGGPPRGGAPGREDER